MAPIWAPVFRGVSAVQAKLAGNNVQRLSQRQGPGLVWKEKIKKSFGRVAFCVRALRHWLAHVLPTLVSDFVFLVDGLRANIFPKLGLLKPEEAVMLPDCIGGGFPSGIIPRSLSHCRRSARIPVSTRAIWFMSFAADG